MSEQTELTRRDASRTIAGAGAFAGGLAAATGSATASDHYDPNSTYCWKDDAPSSVCVGNEFDRFERVGIIEEREFPDGEVVEYPGEVGLAATCSEPQNPLAGEVRLNNNAGWVPTGATGDVTDLCANNYMYLVNFHDPENDCSKAGHVHVDNLEDPRGARGADIC